MNDLEKKTPIFEEIKKLLTNARQRVATQVNAEFLYTY